VSQATAIIGFEIGSRHIGELVALATLAGELAGLAKGSGADPASVDTIIDAFERRMHSLVDAVVTGGGDASSTDAGRQGDADDGAVQRPGRVRLAHADAVLGPGRGDVVGLGDGSAGGVPRVAGDPQQPDGELGAGGGSGAGEDGDGAGDAPGGR
jgi:hypothetical protein